MPLEELLLARHGESEGNVAAGLAERSGAERIDLPARDPDVVLSDRGRRQAAALGEHLGELPRSAVPDAVWVSTYRRARQTAELALGSAGLTLPVHVDERLRDRDLGILDGLTSRGLDALHPEEAARRRFLGKFYYRPPGGESWADLALRVRSVLRDIDATGARRVLIVSHDAVSALVRYVCEGIDEHDLLEQTRRDPMPNAALTRLAREDGAWRLSSLNDVAHLAESDAPLTRHSGGMHRDDA